MTLANSATINSIIQVQTPVTVFRAAAIPSALVQVCVIIPVRNEADNIWATLEALYHQTDASGKPLNKNVFEVLLLVNNCTDNSAAVARSFQLQHPGLQLHIDEISLPPSTANIGTVRRLLMDEAYKRLQHNGIIASTDGDTVVDKKWIYHIVQEIRKGVDAVGGRILTRNNSNPVRLWHLRNVMYRTLIAKAEALIDPSQHDPWPRHFQYFGANLAVTCAAYERAGRLPQVPFLEDNAFFQALNCIDARIRKSYRVKVYTSDRQEGRVEVGFSEQLKKWNDQKHLSQQQMAESVEAQLIRFQCRKMLRQCWRFYIKSGCVNPQSLIKITRQLSINSNWLGEQIKTAGYFGKLWQNVEAELAIKWDNHWRAIPINEAITALRKFISRFD